MDASQRARALRLADELDADGAAYAATYKFQHRLLMEAADLLRELAAEPERVPLTDGWIAFDIGCIECGEPSALIGVYSTKEDAEKACHCAEIVQKNNWTGQHSFEVFRIGGDK